MIRCHIVNGELAHMMNGEVTHILNSEVTHMVNSEVTVSYTHLTLPTIDDV